MSATMEDFDRWEKQLQSLDGTVCVFSHHEGDTDVFGPLCHIEIQSIRHGCVHALNYVLCLVTGEMKQKGVLLAHEAQDISTKIAVQQHSMGPLDKQVALTVLNFREKQEIKSEHENIINRRVIITNALLKVIQDEREDSYLFAASKA